MSIPTSETAVKSIPPQTFTAKRKKELLQAAERPKVLPILAKSIPLVLCAVLQWIAWYWVKQEKRQEWTKVPINVKVSTNTGTIVHGDATDSSVWVSYEAALSYCQANAIQGIAGIGFVFTPEDPFGGLDLDECRDPESGSLTPEAKDFISRLNTYTEVSPSGFGVKAIGRFSRPPDWTNKSGKIEIYHQARWFAMTGCVVPGPSVNVESRQEELNTLCAEKYPAAKPRNRAIPDGYKPPHLSDEVIIRTAGEEKGESGEKFQRLWKGDASFWEGEGALYPSQSEADLALCSKLVFYVGSNSERIDTLFRKSGLYRDKWERDDYRSGTIETAIEDHKGLYFGMKGANVGDCETSVVECKGVFERQAVVRCFAGMARKRVRWLWRDWIPLGEFSVLDADPGVGKSTIADDIAARVTTGADMPLGGLPCGEPAGVLILSAEEDIEAVVLPRLEVAGADLKQVFTLSIRDAFGNDLPHLGKDLVNIEAAITENGIRLVIIDTLPCFMGGVAFKDEDKVRAVLTPLIEMARRTRVAILGLRHLNKKEDISALYRGSGNIAVLAASRSAMLAARDPENPEARILAMNRPSLAKPPRSIRYYLEEVEGEDVARVRWSEEVDYAADEITAQSKRRGNSASQIATPKMQAVAMVFLRSYLKRGPLCATDVYKAAAEVGITKKTLELAKEGVAKSVRLPGSATVWVWKLIEKDTSEEDAA